MFNFGFFNKIPMMAPDGNSGGSGDGSYKTDGPFSYYKISDNLANSSSNKYKNTKQLEGIQTDPKELKTINFKQDYVVIIRKKVYYAATMQSDENYLRVYQVNNFTNIRTSLNVYGRPGSCSVSIKGAERVICAERNNANSYQNDGDSQTKHGWTAWEEMLQGWLSVDDEGINGDQKWTMGQDNWEIGNQGMNVDFKNLLKTREAKYGWRFAEKCDWEPMDEIYVFGKTRNEEYRRGKGGEFKFLPLFFGYIDSVTKTYQAGTGGLLISVSASDHLKLMELSKVMNYPSMAPGMFSNGGIDIRYPQDEFGCFIINQPIINGSADVQSTQYVYTNVFAGKPPHEIVEKLASDSGIPQKFLTKRIEKIKQIPFVTRLRMDNGNGDLFNADFKTRSQVCREAAEKLFLEFFADEEGNIVFKIPNYAVGVNRLLANNLNNSELNTLANGNLLADVGYQLDLKNVINDIADDKGVKYVKGTTLSKKTDKYIPEIKPEYIVSFTLIDTDKEIYNFFEVQMEGGFDMNFDTGMTAIRRVVPDIDSIIKFGLRPHPGVYTTPLVDNRIAAEFFGIMMIVRSLSNRYSGSLTMIEDSSIKIGDPVKFMMYDEHPMKPVANQPDEAVFYVTGIERSITPNNVSYMTLQLRAGRMVGQESIYDISVPLYKYYYEDKILNLAQSLNSYEQQYNIGRDTETYKVLQGDNLQKIVNKQYGTLNDLEWEMIMYSIISLNKDKSPFKEAIQTNNFALIDQKLKDDMVIIIPRLDSFKNIVSKTTKR